MLHECIEESGLRETMRMRVKDTQKNTTARHDLTEHVEAKKLSNWLDSMSKVEGEEEALHDMRVEGTRSVDYFEGQRT